MREYNRVSGRFWTGRTGKAIRALGRDHQVVALYLLTCPSVSWIGIYYLPIPTLCHEVGIDCAAAERVMADLSGIGFAYYDQESELVWVPNAATYQIGRTLEGEKNNLRTGVENDLAALNGHPFVSAFVAKYGSAYRLGSDLQVTSEGSSNAAGPLRYTETETETATATATATETAPATEGPDAAPRRRRHPPGSRFVPDGFTLTDDLRAYARGHGLEAAAVEAEFETFRRHEFTKPLTDWVRAWQRWAVRAVEFRARDAARSPTLGARPSGGRQPTAAEITMQNVRAMLAQDEDPT